MCHIVLPEEGPEPATVSDCNGFIARADILGTGKGTDPTGTTKQLTFDVDNTFIRGSDVGMDGWVHAGTFIWLDP